MSESQNPRGEQVVIWIVMATVTISLVTIVANNIVTGTDEIVQQITRLAITLALGFALYKGENWARWIWIVLYTLGGLISLFGGVILIVSSPIIGILTIILGIVYVTASALLFFMPDVKEHFGIWNH